MPILHRSACLALCSVLLLTQSLPAGDHWPRFRGENGAGISTEAGIPVTWTADQVAWKVELPNVGHSSPVVWGDKVFVTTATEGGKERFLHCRSAQNGTELWQAQVTLGDSKKHLKNSWASSTPCTDGRIVSALFADGSQQLAKAWDLAGKELWTRELGAYESEHGLGVSPILEDGMVIIANDQVGPGHGARCGDGKDIVATGLCAGLCDAAGVLWLRLHAARGRGTVDRAARRARGRPADPVRGARCRHGREAVDGHA